MFLSGPSLHSLVSLLLEYSLLSAVHIMSLLSQTPPIVPLYLIEQSLPIVILAYFWSSLLIASAVGRLELHHTLTHLSLPVSFCMLHLECHLLTAKIHSFCKAQLKFYFMHRHFPDIFSQK